MAIIEIVDSHAIQIHCADTVIVRLVTTVLTGKQMYLLVAICLFCVSTDGTALAGIPGVNLDYGRLVLFRLIEELLFEVVESPRYRNIAVLRFDTLRGMTDTGQIFQNEESVRGYLQRVPLIHNG